MNGNITKEGIQKDLEWMNRIGIGGFQNFDANFFTPQIVDKRLIFMTPKWKDAFLYTTKLANSLDMKMAIAGSPGWSEIGGPWVEPKDGMKKYVWTETQIIGGKPFKGKITLPSSITERFQNVEYQEGIMGGHSEEPPKKYYKDIAVVAYKIPDMDIAINKLNPKITSSGGNFNLKQLTDGDLSTGNKLPPVKVGEYAWIQYNFDEQIIIKSP